MKPTIINKTNCDQKKVIKVIEKILNNIPTKFLCGIDNIVLIKENMGNRNIKYVLGNGVDKQSSIEINMLNSDYNKSLIAINIDFLLAINEHIYYCLRPSSTDSEIQSIKKNRIKYKWMYLGFWSPFVYILLLFSLPFRKSEVVKNILIRFLNKINHS